MLRTSRRLILVMAVVASSGSAVQLAAAQSTQADRNARSLRPYMQPYQVTKLEWELLQFNLLWSGSLSNSGTYLTSFPVIFDHRVNQCANS